MKSTFEQTIDVVSRLIFPFNNSINKINVILNWKWYIFNLLLPFLKKYIKNDLIILNFNQTLFWMNVFTFSRKLTVTTKEQTPNEISNVLDKNVFIFTL